ncbi:hypothetical protein [Streptomyces sp. NPDC000983]|uniref:hypothetical protein n=1 Tax=Streptomyces sp. NPDC000983 TaxID=3154373 RepID=UPI00331EFCBC
MRTELEYLREIERLAHRVGAAASAEGRVRLDEDPEDATPLQRRLNALARVLHHYHFEGDGCLEEGRATVPLFGAAVLRPGGTEDYAGACARFGVEARPEGWALWHTWGESELKVTMVVSAVDTTEGLFQNWSHGREADPVAPLPSQVALVHLGWAGPMTLSPRGARRLGVNGLPLS